MTRRKTVLDRRIRMTRILPVIRQRIIQITTRLRQSQNQRSGKTLALDTSPGRTISLRVKNKTLITIDRTNSRRGIIDRIRTDRDRRNGLNFALSPTFGVLSCLSVAEAVVKAYGPFEWFARWARKLWMSGSAIRNRSPSISEWNLARTGIVLEGMDLDPFWNYVVQGPLAHC